MNEMKIFENKEFGEVRTVELNHEIYFVGTDVAQALGYAEPRSTVSKKVETEDRGVAKIETPSGTQEMTVINESGLYSLVLGSKLESAKKFKHWITSKVIPAIRKHGMYATDELLDNPDLLISVATALKEERERNKALKSENDRMRPKEIFADAVSASRQSILVGELAKILKQNGYDTGEKRLFAWLRNNGYLIKRKGTDYNAPTQRSMELGLFEVKETAVTHADGHVTVNKTTKVTGKGQQYFINKFIAEVA